MSTEGRADMLLSVCVLVRGVSVCMHAYTWLSFLATVWQCCDVSEVPVCR